MPEWNTFKDVFIFESAHWARYQCMNFQRKKNLDSPLHGFHCITIINSNAENGKLLQLDLLHNLSLNETHSKIFWFLSLLIGQDTDPLNTSVYNPKYKQLKWKIIAVGSRGLQLDNLCLNETHSKMFWFLSLLIWARHQLVIFWRN